MIGGESGELKSRGGSSEARTHRRNGAERTPEMEERGPWPNHRTGQDQRRG